MMIRTQIMFPEDMLAQLRAQAISAQTSVSDVVRKRIVFPTVKKKMSGLEGLRLMAKNAYRGKAPRDLSTNDDYLYKLP
ncbi:MAG: hypothetical protein AAB550_03010 [Patescibacteria group bacterium]